MRKVQHWGHRCGRKWQVHRSRLVVVGTDATPCVDGSHMNEVEPQPEDAPGEADLAPGSLRGLASTHPGMSIWMMGCPFLGPLISWAW
jgi:hypothetical protein